MIDTVSLVGMPASGKSTLGRPLAAALGRRFVDGDQLIEQREGASLAEILASRGYLGLREAEQQALLAEDFSGAVLATGGSAVYSPAVMAKLRDAGPLVFIDLPLAQLQRRLGDFAARGIACAPGTDLPALYAERQPLYEAAADIRIDADGCSETALVAAIQQAVLAWPGRP